MAIAMLLNISRDDYIELLKYAQRRNVRILPEVSFGLAMHHL